MRRAARRAAVAGDSSTHGSYTFSSGASAHSGPTRPRFQESQRVGTDDKGGAGVCEDRQPQAGVTRERENQKHRFDRQGERDVEFMVRSVRCPSSTASATLLRSSFISAMSAVSIAVSVPAPPIAIPRVATAIGGASLTPSPIKPTLPYREVRSLIAATLSSGKGRHAPHQCPCFEIASTVR